MNGLLLIDKPEGLSSFDVIRRVRRALGTRKVGHGGTLDPFATGLLTVAVGDATRLLEYMLADWKRYRAVMRLGQATDSQDLTGKVISECQPSPGFAMGLDEVFRAFTGEISQLPPMFSALKKNGVPLYKLARQGAEVEREARKIFIRELICLAVEGYDVYFEVDCSKGTYVRTLAHDMGKSLGCGAHLVELRRIACGSFSVADAMSLEDLEAGDWNVEAPAGLLTPLEAMAGIAVAQAGQHARKQLQHGISPSAEDVSLPAGIEPGELVSLSAGGRLLAVARYAPQRLLEKRGDFELCKVFPEL
jgi:tRNA pseudouridine55 synthase